MDVMEEFEIVRMEKGEGSKQTDLVAKEFPLTLYVNETELVTLACTPAYIEELAVGYLYSENFIQRATEIKDLTLDETQVRITLHQTADLKPELKHRIITSGCGRSTVYTDLYGSGLEKVYSQVQIKATEIFRLARELNDRAQIFKETGGVHNTLMGDAWGEFFIFREDIGRHNAVDKLVGHLLLKEIDPGDKVLVTTGRISSEMLLKTARAKLPILVSRSAPTDLAIQLAYRLGITLIGFARGRRMNIYTHPERIKN